MKQSKQSKSPYHPPEHDCYRLTRRIRIVKHEAGALAISRYPLRVVKLTPLAARALQYCASEHSSEELAQALALSPQKAQALCQQLWRKDLLEAGPALPPTLWPHVSIIIPSYNRAIQLERCLRSLHALDYPQHHLEIIVVNDASTDETPAMLDRLMKEPALQHCSIRVVTHATQQGVANSRNAGAKAAQYDLLAYIDSDCVASSSWLAELVPALQDTHIAAVGGMLRSYDTVSTLGRYEDVLSSLFMGMRPQRVRLEGPLTYLPTASMLVRREAWQQIGGFAPLTFGEDVDFCRRLLTHNFQILYLPQGTVYHDYRTHPAAFLGIRASYASAEAALLQRHPSERRILLLPPEQASFAGLAIMGLWGLSLVLLKRKTDNARIPNYAEGIIGNTSIIGLPFALLLTIFGANKRHHQIRKQRFPINPFTTFWATLRSNMAYTYHLCRHLTRYYTLPLLIIGLLLPPLFLFVFILCGIVIGVDYARLQPAIGFGRYALWSLLDDCAYEVGVVRGCIKYRTWKPLIPVVKKRIISEARTPGL